jgi:hypothetical protein
MEIGKGGYCKVSTRKAQPKMWRLHARASAQISPSQAFSRKVATGPWPEPRCQRRPSREGSGYAQPYPHFIRQRRRIGRQAAPTGGQLKPACPEVPVVESQPHRSKQTDSTPSSAQSVTAPGIADLLENLPTMACRELTRSLLCTASSLPTGKLVR